MFDLVHEDQLLDLLEPYLALYSVCYLTRVRKKTWWLLPRLQMSHEKKHFLALCALCALLLHSVFLRLLFFSLLIGLAWTAMGGEIMFVEATRMGGEGKLTLTGQLGM